MPEVHLAALAHQIEAQFCRYRVEEEEVEAALALIKPDGFERETTDDGAVVYTAEITYQVGKEHLLLSWSELLAQNGGDFGFHTDPYGFDSNPERDFFLQLLSAVNLAPDQVEDIYFTGGLNDPQKTDFFVEYADVDGRWRRYSPDFVIRRRDGRCCIVEIKAANRRDDVVDGEHGRKAVAVRRWVDLNPERLRYEMVFATGDAVAFNQVESARAFIGDKQ